LSVDKKEKCDQASVAYQKLLQNTEILADLLAEQMPDLPIDGMLLSLNELILFCSK
jgi:hypothetical protein